MAEIWPKLQVQWLPGLPGGDSGSGKIPDVTKLTCLYEHENFERGFDNECEFYEDLRPIGLAERLDRFIKTGYGAIQQVAACDECLQTLVLFISQTVLHRKADVAVTLKKLNNKCTQIMSSESAKFFLDLGTSPIFKVNWTPSSVEFDTLNTTSMGYWVDMPRLNASKARSMWREERPTQPLSVANIPCNKHADCGEQPWWFCAAVTACEVPYVLGTAQAAVCSDESRQLLSSGPKCARGVCSDGSTSMAVDGTCPDDAVCPSVSIISPFDLDYFDKFKPIDANDGLAVCPCAFDEQTGEVIDRCAHAKCVAYAAVLEQRATCNSELVRTCQMSVGYCDSAFSCNNPDEALDNPPELAYQCAMPVGSPLSSEITAYQSMNSGLGAVKLAVIVSASLVLAGGMGAFAWYWYH
jgi:hypothetical protein